MSDISKIINTMSGWSIDYVDQGAYNLSKSWYQQVPGENSLHVMLTRQGLKNMPVYTPDRNELWHGLLYITELNANVLCALTSEHIKNETAAGESYDQLNIWKAPESNVQMLSNAEREWVRVSTVDLGTGQYSVVAYRLPTPDGDSDLMGTMYFNLRNFNQLPLFSEVIQKYQSADSAIRDFGTYEIPGIGKVALFAHYIPWGNCSGQPDFYDPVITRADAQPK